MHNRKVFTQRSWTEGIGSRFKSLHLQKTFVDTKNKNTRGIQCPNQGESEKQKLTSNHVPTNSSDYMTKYRTFRHTLPQSCWIQDVPFLKTELERFCDNFSKESISSFWVNNLIKSLLNEHLPNKRLYVRCISNWEKNRVKSFSYKLWVGFIIYPEEFIEINWKPLMNIACASFINFLKTLA